MGFLARLFGKNKEQRQLKEAIAPILRILEDEEHQLNLANPMLKEMVQGLPAIDQVPGGTGLFGFEPTNPIPVNGPIGEIAYLSRLQTVGGERLFFHRIGSVKQIDVFEAVTFSGDDWFIFYLDPYHPRRSRIAPAGFRLSGRPMQFSGFLMAMRNFPNDFAAMKDMERERTGLSIAYIPTLTALQFLEKNIYRPPTVHLAKLDLVRRNLSTAVFPA